MLVESILLAFGGAAAGIALGAALVRVLRAALPPDTPRLSSISLDFDPHAAPAALSTPGTLESDADLSSIDFAPDRAESGDPLERKLELAEEFRQIGDMEGARDLLQEVVAKASGALKSKAQGMLDDLA